MGARVDLTDEAAALLAKLEQRHGPLMFHQSGGCCDGTAPMVYPAGEFRLGAHDVQLGSVGGAGFWTSGAQAAAWALLASKASRMARQVSPESAFG